VHAAASARWLPDLRRAPLVSHPGQGAAARRGWLAGLLADLASLYENPRLLRLCVVSLLAVSGNYVAWGFFTVYYTEHLHAGMHAVGLALACSAALGIAAYFGVGPLVKRYGGGRCLAATLTLYLAMYLGMSLTRNPLVVARSTRSRSTVCSLSRPIRSRRSTRARSSGAAGWVC